jgi:hypothetical protein
MPQTRRIETYESRPGLLRAGSLPSIEAPPPGGLRLYDAFCIQLSISRSARSFS